MQVHQDFLMAMVIIFVNKKQTANELVNMLGKKGVKATQLVGGLEPADRDKIIDSFRKMEFTTLITTNVLARGIDVPEVDLVIQYDVPLQVTYGFKEPDYANF